MRSWIWLRALAVVLAIFAAGHTVGTAAPKVTHGPMEAVVFQAMQGFRFPVMGFERSYWELYRGFALTISVLMVVMAVVAWQLSAVSRRSPRAALPMAGTLLGGCVGMLVLGPTFFFWGPIVFSALAVVCAAGAVVMLGLEARAEGLV